MKKITNTTKQQKLSRSRAKFLKTNGRINLHIAKFTKRQMKLAMRFYDQEALDEFE